MSQFTGALAGPMLRAWQNDPFNRNAQYFQGFDAPVCMGALTAAIGAPWVSLSSEACLAVCFAAWQLTRHESSHSAGSLLAI